MMDSLQEHVISEHSIYVYGASVANYSFEIGYGTEELRTIRGERVLVFFGSTLGFSNPRETSERELRMITLTSPVEYMQEKAWIDGQQGFRMVG